MAALGRALVLGAIVLSLGGLVSADEPGVWSNETFEFAKADYANPHVEANQDRITDNVWLTRGNNHGIFNHVEENSYDTQSPEGTEWAYGSAEDWETLSFESWYDWFNRNPGGMVGTPAVLHLLETDVYIDITFTSWTTSDNGGGFSWERATEGVPGEKVWTGTPVAFTKGDYADIGLPANQDRIVDGVWLTRNDRRGLFNVAREASYDAEGDSTPPTGTEWAWGSTDELADLAFAPWKDWANNNPPGTVGKTAVVHLIEDDVYIDIKFLSWTTNDNGGGFSYERATEGVPGETVWTGPPVTFTKADYADWKLEANQDRITDNVWITRQDNRGIFNIKTEPSFYNEIPEPGSPYNTEWAFGTTADLDSLDFRGWYDWHGGSPASVVGQDAVLHLIREDVFIDIKFLSYSGGGSAGGFSYQRSTEGVPGETVWTGAPITFTRPDNVDWRVPANQDRITRWTWLARQNTAGMFNASFENSYDNGTFYTCLVEWAWGVAADWNSLSFTEFRSFKQQHNGNAFLNRDAVMHLLDTDVYVDVKFLSWTQDGGGGFTYERTTEGVPGEKVWTGPRTVFSRANGADTGIAANQDRITPEVWLTRRENAGLFNATRTPGFDFYWKDTASPSPLDTEWALGTAADRDSLSFVSWYALTKRPRGARTPNIVGDSLCLHLISEDIYLDVRFSSWAASDSGGGFTYTRSTEGTPGETVWTGPPVVFVKKNYADPATSMDMITDGVWFARGDNQGPYNAVYESGWRELIGASTIERNPPTGTEWAYGRARDWQSLTFKPWREWHGEDPLSSIWKPAVVHLIKDDIYLDITFTSWTSDDNGGGFSYRRATARGPMTGVKASGKVNFAAPGADSLKVRGEVDPGESFTVNGAGIEVSVGGAGASFTLDARGKGTTLDGGGKISFKRNRKTGGWKYSVSLKNGDFADLWAEQGLIEETLQIPVQLETVVTVDGAAYGSTGTYTYKARAGKSGSWK